jgi:hypothetical protein
VEVKYTFPVVFTAMPVTPLSLACIASPLSPEHRVRASPGYGGGDADQGIYPAYTVIDSVPDEYMAG